MKSCQYETISQSHRNLLQSKSRSLLGEKLEPWQFHEEDAYTNERKN